MSLYKKKKLTLRKSYQNPDFAPFVTENSTYALYASIPARVFYDEVVLISLFGILSPLIACYFASKSILKMKIVEVLHE